MKVLVTGANGQLARSLGEARLPENWQLNALGRPQLDLLLPDTISKSFDRFEPHLVINTAAYTNVDQAEAEEELARKINADGAGHIAQICERHGIPLIHISTDYVFDGTKIHPYREDDFVAPTSAYGRSKLAGEQRVADTCARYIILRTAWLYSSFGRNFVETMLRLAVTRDEIKVVDDQFGNPTYAPDLADCIVAMAGQIFQDRYEDIPWGIYHAAGTGDASWYDVACETFIQSKQIGGPVTEIHPIRASEFPSPAKRPANSRLDCSKLDKNFGLRLPSWQVNIAECVRRLHNDKLRTSSDI